MFLEKLKALVGLALAVVVVGVGSLVPGVFLMGAPAQPSDHLAHGAPRSPVAAVAPMAPFAPMAPEDEPAKASKKEEPKPGQKDKKPAWGGNAKAEEVLRKSFVTKKAPRLVVDTFNGTIEVKTGAAGVTNAKVVRSAQAATPVAAWEDLKNIDVQLTQERDTILVTAKPKGEQKQTNRAAAVEVEVPPGATLELRGSNGKVAVTGATRDVAVLTSNGGVEVKGSKGALRLKTNNGGIRVEGGAGTVVLETSNGSIDVKDTKAKVEAKTSNGSIRFTGSLAAGDNSFTTSNGSVAMVLPAGARFRLDAQTSLGRVTCQFPHEQSKDKTKTQLRTSVGDNPAINLKLRTSLGSIEVRPK